MSIAVAALSMPEWPRNKLLRRFPSDLLAEFLPLLERVALPLRTVILAPGQQSEQVYFIESGMISVIAILEDGEQIEVGVVGSEGMTGTAVLLGASPSPFEHLVQLEGTALRITSMAFRTFMMQHPTALLPLLRYVDAYHVQVSQTAVCNGHHDIEQRLCRWILMTHDRVERDYFSMTQESMSFMLGVRRPSVTLAVGGLQRAGLIRSMAGVVTVLNRAGLESVACECYGAVRRRFAQLAQADP